MEDLSAFSARPRLAALLDHFAEITDARQGWKVMYPLREVLFLVVCGTIASGDDYDDIVDWGKAHLAFLRGFAEFHFGIPCADWLRCIMNRIDPKLFMDCFSSWVAECWPDKLDLNGFTYRSLGGFSASEKDLMIYRPVEWFEGWLGKQPVYTPGPYQQLAAVLREQGQPDTADEILYAGKEEERAQSTSMGYIEATANKWFIGYGYHKFWSMYWAFGFLIAGTVLLWLSGEGRRVSRHYSLPYGIFYSFDLLLPIIRLREKHYQIDLRGWVRYYFYFHKIMGYVLGGFLIAGISGLVK